MSHKCKVILVGEAGVGKTCLIKQYVYKTFDSEEIPTIAGVELYKELNLNNEKIRLTIWDTCGQERFRSINKIFMNKSNIVILVYDITKSESFKELQNYWYKTVVSNLGKDIIYGVAANKTDLFADEKVNAKDGFNYAQSIGAIFKETSSTIHDSIEELFKGLAMKYLKKFSKNKKNGTFDIKNSKKNEKKKSMC